MFRINMLSAIPRCLLFEVVFSLTTTNYTSASITENMLTVCERRQWLFLGDAYEISRASKKHAPDKTNGLISGKSEFATL